MLKKFFSQCYHIWITERPNQQAAALAYYSIFSFAPVIFIAFSIIGQFFDHISASDRFFQRLEGILGAEIGNLVHDSIASLEKSSSSGSALISIISSLVMLFAASGLFYQLQFSLNTVWRVPPPQKGQTTAIIRQRLFSFLVVIGVGLLGILAISTNMLIAWFGSILEKLIGIQGSLAFTTRIATVILAGLSFALLYKILPNTKVAWRDVWLGAAIATGLVLVAVFLAGLFFRYTSPTSALEAAGAFAVLLTAFYYIAQIFLLGAVCCRVYADLFGSRRSIAAEAQNHR